MIFNKVMFENFSLGFCLPYPQSNSLAQFLAGTKKLCINLSLKAGVNDGLI